MKTSFRLNSLLKPVAFSLCLLHVSQVFGLDGLEVPLLGGASAVPSSPPPGGDSSGYMHDDIGGAAAREVSGVSAASVWNASSREELVALRAESIDPGPVESKIFILQLIIAHLFEPERRSEAIEALAEELGVSPAVAESRIQLEAQSALDESSPLQAINGILLNANERYNTLSGLLLEKSDRDSTKLAHIRAVLGGALERHPRDPDLARIRAVLDDVFPLHLPVGSASSASLALPAGGAMVSSSVSSVGEVRVPVARSEQHVGISGRVNTICSYKYSWGVFSGTLLSAAIYGTYYLINYHLNK